ncbi:putative helicase MOV-10 isoform X2 [Bactrocera neohumeralis]|uniref:putative helicase MOV-10 isoform X2 n=1 Tax=Bactrocera neohumeralis TaxID=98809 RepID=UPI0021651D90|nr:putative helicase MOV-10 isoform X2 [Bactrocera neohumeralis]
MPKKSRKTRKSPFLVFEDVIGQFLIYLYELQEPYPKSNWLIKRKEVRKSFVKFLNLPKNDKICHRIGKDPAGKIGTFLSRTGYLMDLESGSEFFCINYQKVMHYKEIEELHKTIKQKLVLNANENEKRHRLANNLSFKVTQALEQFLPPPALLELKKKKFADEVLCEYSSQFANYFNGGQIFTPENILGAMKLLLQIEDVDNFSKYRRIIQRDVKLSQSQQQPNRYSFTLSKTSRKIGYSYEVLLSRYNRVLIVAECAETKALTKDQILEFLISGSLELNVRGKTIATTYIGRIEDVNDKSKKATIETEGEPDPKASYLIIFCPARRTLCYQYYALSLYGERCAMLQHFLFPNPVVTASLPRMCKPFFQTLSNEYIHTYVCSLSFYDKNIATNPEQIEAVHNIVSGCKNSKLQIPYIIFGPPGTGKTSIIVESILQLLLHDQKSRILVTAGPNCACDEIALRICKTLSLGEKPRSNILARIYCCSQESRRENLHKLLLEYSNMYDWHFWPNIAILQQYRIVVCTLSCLGKLITGGLQHFTHVFLDEAAACSMSEGLIGVVGGLTKKSNFILSGDHKQLGPIINSKRAEALGLGISLMERQLQHKCYDVNEANGHYNRSIQTRLCRNFRSHPAIVKLFNELYYDNKLESMASIENTNLAAKWKGLHDPNFPILFHAVNGREQYDEDSSSFYNWEEGELVLKYVDDLLKSGLGDGRKLEETDIGIISPYRSQCISIQEDLNNHFKIQIETGSVETYRGKEKAVIIVSFVRSRYKSLGFLRNPKRLNVVLSRAKSLLILIGNDVTLSKQSDYEFVIKECKRHGNFIPAPVASKKN